MRGDLLEVVGMTRQRPRAVIACARRDAASPSASGTPSAAATAKQMPSSLRASDRSQKATRRASRRARRARSGARGASCRCPCPGDGDEARAVRQASGQRGQLVRASDEGVAFWRAGCGAPPAGAARARRRARPGRPFRCRWGQSGVTSRVQQFEQLGRLGQALEPVVAVADQPAEAGPPLRPAPPGAGAETTCARPARGPSGARRRAWPGLRPRAVWRRARRRQAHSRATSRRRSAHRLGPRAERRERGVVVAGEVHGRW